MKFYASKLKKETKLALIADENYTFERIEKMIKENEDCEVILEEIKRNDVTVEFLEKFAEHNDYMIRKEVATSDKISDKTLDILSCDNIDDVVIAAIRNPKISLSLLDEKIKGIGTMYSTSFILPLAQNSKLTSEMLTKLYDIFKKADDNNELMGLSYISIVRAFLMNKNSSDYIIKELYEHCFDGLDDDFLIKILVANDRSDLIEELIFSYSKIETVFWCKPKNINLLPEDLFYELWDIYITSSINWENNILFEFITTPYLTENMIEKIFSEMLDLLNYENYRGLVRNFKLTELQLNTLWIRYNIRKRKDSEFALSQIILYDFLENPNTDEKIKNYIRSIL